jgi:hypothetical protein
MTLIIERKLTKCSHNEIVRKRFKANTLKILERSSTLNPAHQDLSNNTKCTFQFLRIFFLKLRFNFIFSEEIIQYSRTFALQVQKSWNQAHAALLAESFPKRPRTRSEASWFGGSHKYKQNKTNKQTTFLHR